MKKLLLTMVSVLLFGTQSYAQDWKLRRYEGFIGLGPTNFFSDIGGFSMGDNAGGIRDFRIRQVRGNLGAGIKYRITRRITARAGLTYGILNGNDKSGFFTGREYISNVSLLEPALMGEYYIKRHIGEESFLFTQSRKKTFKSFMDAVSIYTFAGLGEIWYKTKANDRLAEAMMVNKVNSSDRTEALPFGAGITINLLPDFNLGFEYGARYVFQDRIDGYAPPASNSRDYYHFLNFTIVYKKRTNIRGLPEFKRKQNIL